MKLSLRVIKRIRASLRCSLQHARHLYIKSELKDMVDAAETKEDFKKVLTEIINHGNTTFS